MSRYLQACNNDTKKAMTLYRYNLELSQELLTVISCFEVALRNAIDTHYSIVKGQEWLSDSVETTKSIRTTISNIVTDVLDGSISNNTNTFNVFNTNTINNGMFSVDNCKSTAKLIRDAKKNLGTSYSHNKLIAELGFGFWRYLFNGIQYNAAGNTLLQIFTNRPISPQSINGRYIHFNQLYVFDQLKQINKLRNRIAHHEPICFVISNNITTKSTQYARTQYAIIIELFHWLGIDAADLLFGLDHVLKVCDKIDRQ
ncbi:Abi family protein [Myroides odoratimimus]|nr:Abi family protein [Myroides odoratimimus]MDM1401236.1 Abi family protein [Myroides odoratimimus]MDM1457214.1 Abi family protein [Myroides odoratimimus]